MNVILLGAPGAGKGTQGALLAERRRLVRISTGDLLRSALRRGTPLGLEAQHFMNAGELVPDTVIMELVRDVLQDPPAYGFEPGGGSIFDGFPRTLPQAVALDALLAELGQPLDTVVVIEVDPETLVRRLSGRRSCPRCGAVYNVYFEPPRAEGVCDACGGALVERPDDDPGTVRRRLEVYRAQTEPLIAYYEESRTPVRWINGDRSVEEVYADLAAALEPERPGGGAA